MRSIDLSATSRYRTRQESLPVGLDSTRRASNRHLPHPPMPWGARQVSATALVTRPAASGLARHSKVVAAGILAGASLLALTLFVAGPAKADDRSNTIDNEFNGVSDPAVPAQDKGTGSSVAASHSGSDGEDLAGAVVNAVTDILVSFGIVSNSDSGDADQRSNAVTDSFNGSDGAPIVQQNTGDDSVLEGKTNRVTNATNVGGVNDTASTSADISSLGTPITDDQTTRSNLIDPSFGNSTGASLVQQNNGNDASLAAVDSVTEVVGDTGDINQSATASGSVSGINASNGAVGRDNKVEDSFGEYAGETKVQQNNGDASALSATHSIVTLGGIAASVNQTAGASGSVSGNTTSDGGSTRENAVAASFTDANGVVTLQQNNANGSVLSAATATVGPGAAAAPDNPGSGTGSEETNSEESASTQETVLLGPPHNLLQASEEEGGADGDTPSPTPSGTHQSATVSGKSEGNTATTTGGKRGNKLTDSFGGATGVVTTQQNNGDNAVLGAASTTIADTDGNDLGPAASTAALQSTVSGNTASYVGATDSGGYSNSIAGSFNQAQTISVTAQQNNGPNSVMGSAISIRIGN